jgi:PAS domain S-box-containing protein
MEKDEIKRLRAIINSAVDGIITIDDKGIVTSFNPSCEKMFGYKVEEVLGENIKMLMPEPFHNEHDTYLKSYLDTGQRKMIGMARETEAKRKNGEVFPIYLSVSEIKVEGERFFTGIIRDISEKVISDKKLEIAILESQTINRKLVKSEAKTRAIIDNAIDGIITIDSIGTIASFNPACEKIFGYEEKEVLGQNVKILMPKRYSDEHDGYLKKYKDTGEKKIIGIGREVEGKRKNGEVFPLDLSISQIQLEGEIIYAGIVRDISEKKSAQTRFDTVMKKLKKSNEELEQFAYIASHDLKNPLRGVDNISQWIEEDLVGEGNESIKSNLGLLRGRVKRMEKLLDSLLEYSRVNSNNTQKNEVNCDKLLDNVISLISAPETFSITYDKGFKDVTVYNMPLFQVFFNLIVNAIKHHDKESGKIVVGYSALDNGYEFYVQDDGPGIDKRYHSKIFEIFQTLKPKDEVDGCGMGLALVKKIISSVNCEISVQSEVGKGSKFVFTWPNADSNKGGCDAKKSNIYGS